MFYSLQNIHRIMTTSFEICMTSVEIIKSKQRILSVPQEVICKCNFLRRWPNDRLQSQLKKLLLCSVDDHRIGHFCTQDLVRTVCSVVFYGKQRQTLWLPILIEAHARATESILLTWHGNKHISNLKIRIFWFLFAHIPGRIWRVPGNDKVKRRAARFEHLHCIIMVHLDHWCTVHRKHLVSNLLTMTEYLQ